MSGPDDSGTFRQYLQESHTGPRRHSVHVDEWPSDGPDVAPVECRHGYGSGCPDCDVPSYLPAVLDSSEPDE